MYLAVRVVSLAIRCFSQLTRSSACDEQEDRILCWELVAKRGSAWLLHYQRSAYAVTVRSRSLESSSNSPSWSVLLLWAYRMFPTESQIWSVNEEGGWTVRSLLVYMRVIISVTFIGTSTRSSSTSQSVANWCRSVFGVLSSDHTIWRKSWLHVELLYQTFQQLFAVRFSPSPLLASVIERMVTDCRFWLWNSGSLWPIGILS